MQLNPKTTGYGATLRTQAVAHLADTSDELWLIADGSELRKPHARAQQHPNCSQGPNAPYSAKLSFQSADFSAAAVCDCSVRRVQSSGVATQQMPAFCDAGIVYH